MNSRAPVPPHEAAFFMQYILCASGFSAFLTEYHWEFLHYRQQTCRFCEQMPCFPNGLPMKKGAEVFCIWWLILKMSPFAADFQCFFYLYKAIVRTHSNQWKRSQRCSASFRRQYCLEISPFRMLCGRHRGFPVMFCLSDVKGNITLSCIAFSRRVSPFPFFSVPVAFSVAQPLFRSSRKP